MNAINYLSQCFTELIVPSPKFTEKDLPDLSGRVYLITGGASGIGFELCKILYSKSATVYIAGRSQSNADRAMAEIRASSPASKGVLRFIHIDLSDLSSVKTAAMRFLEMERRLDVVWHNAGVMIPVVGSRDRQGHELQLGTNVIAPWLLQHFLTPLQQTTASLPTTPRYSVRTIWVSSIANNLAPYPGGINWDDINYDSTSFTGMKGALSMEGRPLMYGQSKAGNIILAAEAAKRWSGSGVISLSLNPGNLKSGLDRTTPGWARFMLDTFLYYPPYYGALTELFAGLSPLITEEEHNGRYVIPWGRFGEPRVDIKSALEENGERLWRYCWDECREFM